MGEVSLVLIILVVEALLMAGLAGLAYVYHARLRRGSAGTAASSEDIAILLARKVEATRGAVRSRSVLPGGDPRDAAALQLRIKVLELEQRLADPRRRGDDYWAGVCAGYAPLAGVQAPPAAGETPADAPPRPEADCDEEARELNRLLELQEQTLDRLSAALAGLIEQPEVHWRQEAEIQSLREGTRKLRQGLEILSDEGRFLAQRLDELEGTAQPPPVAAAGG